MNNFKENLINRVNNVLNNFKEIGLIKESVTQNFNIVSDSNSYDLIKDEIEKLKKEGYKTFDASNGEKCGAKGLFAYQMPPNGVDEPIIYFLEIFQLSKTEGKITSYVCFLIEHRYDINGNFISHKFKEIDNKTWKDLYDDICTSIQLSDSNVVIGLPNSSCFDDAVIEAKNFINNRNEKIVY